MGDASCLRASPKIVYDDAFGAHRFARTIRKMAAHMLNGFFYLELAMYMRSPGAFCALGKG